MANKLIRPRRAHGTIPAACISMIGRDQKFRGGSYGGDLLADALRRIAAPAEAIGVTVVMRAVPDCGGSDRTSRRRALYVHYGFRRLAPDPIRVFLPVSE